MKKGKPSIIKDIARQEREFRLKQKVFRPGAEPISPYQSAPGETPKVWRGRVKSFLARLLLGK